MSSKETLLKRLDFTSSGDVQKDEQFVERFSVTEERVRAGQCPNDCGPLEFNDGVSSCLKCGFASLTVVAGLRNWSTR